MTFLSLTSGIMTLTLELIALLGILYNPIVLDDSVPFSLFINVGGIEAVWILAVLT